MNAVPGCGEQEAQQVELADGQRDGSPARSRVAGRVDDEVAVDQRAAARGAVARAAQHRVDPQHQLARAERLGDVVVGAQLEPDDPVGLRRPSAVSMITGTSLVLAQPAADLEPVDAGQHQVEHDQVGRARRACARSAASPSAASSTSCRAARR